MSFLAPLYVAGLAAVSLPILLHLIRQMPRGRLRFSSLMFLTESPPKITRRSRVDNWLLLLMRAAAVMLLALAFARPFLREAFSLTMETPPGRHVALLLDTSAGMQRGDAWPQALQMTEEAIRQLDTADYLTVYTFAQRLQPLHDPESPFTAASTRVDEVRRLLQPVRPGWQAADLGTALSSAAQELVERRDRDSSAAPLQILVISDFAEGGALDALQTFAWPQDVRVDVRVVRPEPKGNAGLQRIVEREEDQASDDVRVRVSNDLLAERDRFVLQWFHPSGHAVDTPTECYVPAGQSRVFRVRRPVAEPAEETPASPGSQPSSEDSAPDGALGEEGVPATPEARNATAARHATSPENGEGSSDVETLRRESVGYQLRLLDDPHEFDNVLHYAPYYRQVARIGYLGQDGEADPSGELFFLRTALGDTARYTTELTRIRSDSGDSAGQGSGEREGDRAGESAAESQADREGDRAAGGGGEQQGDSAKLTEAGLERLSDQSAVFVGGRLDRSQFEPLREYVREGGIVWWSLARGTEADVLRELLDDPSMEIGEARVGNYLMLSDVELRHPLFEPFRDPRFADFTTIRFWRSRELSWEDESRYSVLARFDNGMPALIQWTLGEGRLFLLATSWRPEDSQLALSTKFVPLLGGLLREAGFREDVERRVLVGQALEFPEEEPSTSTVVTPIGERLPLEAGVTRFTDTDVPGLYRWTRGDQQRVFAVDVATSESRTTPMDPSMLEQYGVPLGRQASQEKQQEAQRQMMDQELEGRQQVWRWMLAAALVLLVGETWLAGRVDRGRRRNDSHADGLASKELES
jgi:hypothetical protein